MQKLKNAFDFLHQTKSEINKSEKVFLFLDYDGTLTEIKNNPEYAKPGKKLIEFINTTDNPKFVISIISGRTLKDLVKILNKTDLTKINLIGNHGAEIKFAAINNNVYKYSDISMANYKTIKILKKKIREYANNIANSQIEEKPFSFALHYRNSPLKEMTKIKELTDYLKEQKKIYKFRYLKMKKVIEVLPTDLNKGSVVPLILEKYVKSTQYIKNTFIICIGDDITDEDLFNANQTGINIKVSSLYSLTKTAASYYLKNPDEVLSFLEKIVIL